MKQILKILKYLIVYGLLMVGPAVVVTIVVVVINRQNGCTMNSDAVWDSPYMLPALAVGTLLNIIVFLWRRWAVLSLGRISRHDVCLVVAMSVVVFIGWYFPENSLQRLIDVPDNITEKEFDQLTGGVFGFIDTGILAPVSEELLCRGAILGSLFLMMPRRPWVCIVISALIFGLIHMNPVQVVFGFFYGLLLGWLCWRTKSLLPGIVVHVVNNSIVLLLPDSVDDAVIGLGVAPRTIILVASLMVLVYGIRWFHRKYSIRERHIVQLSF